jgi:hypothetical protein
MSATTQDKQAIGRRAVACKHWRWMPGMAIVSDDDRSGSEALIVSVPDECEWPELIVVFDRADHTIGDSNKSDWKPDLDDPATLGCLLALVREAWGDETLCAVRDGDYVWRMKTCAGPRIVASGKTEAEALIAALDAAPERTP